MDSIKNLIGQEGQSESAGLLASPGAATVKAFFIMYPFLQTQRLPKGMSRGKALTAELANDITFLDRSITPAGFTDRHEAEPTDVEEVSSEETPVVSKALGMVHHLRHTHTKHDNS